MLGNVKLLSNKALLMPTLIVKQDFLLSKALKTAQQKS